MKTEEQLVESNKRLQKIREFMDSLSMKGMVVNQGLFRKPLFIEGAPPPQQWLDVYALELMHNIELKQKLEL